MELSHMQAQYTVLTTLYLGRMNIHYTNSIVCSVSLFRLGFATYGSFLLAIILARAGTTETWKAE